MLEIGFVCFAFYPSLLQAVLDDSLPLVRLLVAHGADINKRDVDTWTPLHAAAANGHADIVKYLMDKGANTETLTEDGETALDLVDGEDYETMSVLLDSEIKQMVEKGEKLKIERKEPEWVRRESRQERNDAGKQNLLEVEEKKAMKDFKTIQTTPNDIKTTVGRNNTELSDGAEQVLNNITMDTKDKIKLIS